MVPQRVTFPNFSSRHLRWRNGAASYERVPIIISAVAPLIISHGTPSLSHPTWRNRLVPRWPIHGPHRSSVDRARRGGGAQTLKVTPAGLILTRPDESTPTLPMDLSPALPMGMPEIEPDLTEWDNGDDEGRLSADILKSKPRWNLFTDGSPQGESPAQIATRADRLMLHLRGLAGNIALFSHGHFCRVLAARWIGLSVANA